VLLLILLVLRLVADDDGDPAVSDTVVRFYCPELTHEGQWHHLAVIFNKAGILKNSSVSLYIDGNYVNTQKVCSYCSGSVFPCMVALNSIVTGMKVM
jgi:hypothetical protein